MNNNTKKLVFAKNINDTEITGLVEIVEGRCPIVFCYCEEEEANIILGFQKQSDEADKLAIGVLNFVTKYDSPFSIMYGHKTHRFASNDDDHTSEEVLEIYKKTI